MKCIVLEYAHNSVYICNLKRNRQLNGDAPVVLFVTLLGIKNESQLTPLCFELWKCERRERNLLFGKVWRLTNAGS